MMMGIGLRPVIGLMGLLIGSTALASQFGYNGRHGQDGPAGRDGRDGQAVVIVADGTAGHYDISGTDGYDGRQGEDGYNATSCSPPHRPSNNLKGASGGDGGRGGRGGIGGDGGNVTVYYEDVADLRLIAVRGAPGQGGRSGWGGRGGQGCLCNEYSWTIPGADGQPGQTFTCTNGERGYDAGSGSEGSNGSYGSVTLINQLEPLAEETPSIDIDMANLEQSTFTLSKNFWETRRGANALFATGTRLADSYKLFTGREEQKVAIRWLAERPITDFSRWITRLAFDNERHPRLYLPNGLWIETQWLDEGDLKVLEIRKIVKTSELAYIQFSNFSDIGPEHTVSIRDSKGMAHILNNGVYVEFWTVVNGQWKRHYQDDVPESALEITANQIKIKMGELGIDQTYLEDGTRAYIKTYVTRSLGGNSVRYVLDSNYTIKVTIDVGDLVEAKEDANLYSGNRVVGSVSAGDQFHVRDISGDWIALSKLDGTDLSGWIQRSKLKFPETE